MSFRFEVGPYQSAGPKKAQAFARSSRASQPRSHRSGSPFLPGSYRATSLRAGSRLCAASGARLGVDPGTIVSPPDYRSDDQDAKPTLCGRQAAAVITGLYRAVAAEVKRWRACPT